MTDEYRSESRSAKKLLNPLYGSFCRTQAYETDGETTWLEACLSHPESQQWQLCKITSQSGKTKVDPAGPPLDFNRVLETFVIFEKHNAGDVCTSHNLHELAFYHYKAFAEREGYVFDENGLPHARPARAALPDGAVFLDEDVSSANQHVQRPEAFFHEDKPYQKPATHFLFDQFQKAATGKSVNQALNEIKILHIFNRFTGHIDEAAKNLSEYVDNYQTLGQALLVQKAEESLDQAALCLKQAETYGLNLPGFHGFVEQCKLLCDVTHAQSLYVLMHKNLGDLTANESSFLIRYQSAMARFRAMDGGDTGSLRELILQSPPQKPAIMVDFVENYKKQHASFIDSPVSKSIKFDF